MIDFGLIVAAAVLIAVSAVLVYTLSTLREWIGNKIGNFRNRQIIAGALRERLETGDYGVYPFVYDDQEDKVLAVNRIQTKALDEELDNAFAGKDKVVLDIQN